MRTHNPHILARVRAGLLNKEKCTDIARDTGYSRHQIYNIAVKLHKEGKVPYDILPWSIKGRIDNPIRTDHQRGLLLRFGFIPATSQKAAAERAYTYITAWRKLAKMEGAEFNLTVREIFPLPKQKVANTELHITRIDDTRPYELGNVIIEYK